jgi:polysaccharide chain length determinant protein (PEP-CTERM system associated)
METFDITKYIQIALKRKYWIIIPFLLTLLGGLTYWLSAPRIYQAETLILVQPQKVPEDFVRSIVSASIDDRLRTINQQVTSRTNLESLIEEYHLFADRGPLFLEQKVEVFRKRIDIDISHRDVRRGSEANAFTIIFRYEDPKKAKNVANALASSFITENLKIREAQAMGTSGFFADELESYRKKLEAKEEDLKKYRERYMGAMPEHLDTNLRILERLQAQLEPLQTNLNDAENRRILYQKEIQNAGKAGSMIMSSETSNGTPQDLVSLRKSLESLEIKYTENHPDVIRLRDMIAKLEAEQPEPDMEGEFSDIAPSLGMVDPALIRQLEAVEAEIESSKAEIDKVKTQIKVYELRVEETPKREQEVLTLTRDYENLKEYYNSLLNRKLEAEIAVSMERKQQGEQFRVIDPAKEPTMPISPDTKKIFLMTLAMGLGLGFGLVYLVEMMDTSYRTPEELEEELQVPVLVSTPFLYTETQLRSRKIKEILKLAFLSVGFVFCALSIVLAKEGVDKTLGYLKTLLERI